MLGMREHVQLEIDTVVAELLAQPIHTMHLVAICPLTQE